MSASPVIRMIALEDLILDERFQQRHDGLDHAHLDRLAEHADRLPPPVAFFDEAKEVYYLPGGFHRYEVAKRAGKTEMACEVQKGDWEAAFTYSLGENAEHGLPRTSADKKKAVRSALRVRAEKRLAWTDVDIACWCLCSNTYVGILRREMEKDSTTSDIPEDIVVKESVVPVETPAPDLDVAEEQGVTLRETARGATVDPLPAARTALGRGLAEVVRGLAALGLLAGLREQVAAIRAAVWGERPTPTRPERGGKGRRKGKVAT